MDDGYDTNVCVCVVSCVNIPCWTDLMSDVKTSVRSVMMVLCDK